jgi:hypothetical protein
MVVTVSPSQVTLRDEDSGKKYKFEWENNELTGINTNWTIAWNGKWKPLFVSGSDSESFALYSVS